MNFITTVYDNQINILFTLYIDERKRICLKISHDDNIYYCEINYAKNMMTCKYGEMIEYINSTEKSYDIDSGIISVTMNNFTICGDEFEHVSSLQDNVNNLTERLEKIENEERIIYFDVYHPSKIVKISKSDTTLDLTSDNIKHKMIAPNFVYILMEMPNLKHICIFRDFLSLFDYERLYLPNVDTLTIVYRIINEFPLSNPPTSKAISIPNIKIINIIERIVDTDMNAHFWKSFTNLKKISTTVVNDRNKLKGLFNDDYEYE